jgi:lipoprotein-anchoring transpeptidase ErfK/SrfK
MRRTVGLTCTVLVLSLVVGSPAQAVRVNPTQDAKRIEAALARLGLPVGVVDGTWDNDTARATCAWRELTGREILRSWPLVEERRDLKLTTTLLVPKYMKIGVNVDRQCQTAYWVVKAPIEVVRVESRTVTAESTTATGETFTVSNIETSTVTSIKMAPTIERVMPVSTGQSTPSGRLETVPGVHRVARTVNGWWQSTLYVDGHMYRPMFFIRGQALHGSINDSLVKTYPASHGCVRMLHADIDALWDAGFSMGDTVKVYGVWQG